MKPRKAKRREQAIARNTEYAALTPKQQLAKLDTVFGAGNGAARQRAKLQLLIDKGKVGHER
jgi:hypothetical protein